MVVYHKSCGCAVFRTNSEGVREYLLLHYPNGHWDLVKGHVEDDDQDEITTAIRELKEETALDPLKVFDGFMVTIHYEYMKRGEKQEKDVDFFLIQVGSEEVELSHEHQGYVWMEFESAINKITFDNATDVVVAAEGFLKSLR